MPDAKSPYPSVLSPTSSTLFSDLELHKPIKIKLKTSGGSPTSPPKWKDVAREIEAETSLSLSPPLTSYLLMKRLILQRHMEISLRHPRE